MISRALAETQIVTAFPYKSFLSCTNAVSGFTSACGGTYSGALGQTWSGYIIDRLGLQREFASVLIVPSIVQNPNASATSCNYFYGADFGIQHASSTSGSWQDFSTGEWPVRQALLAQTTTTATSTAITDLAPTREGLALGPQAYFLTTGFSCNSSTQFSAYVSSQPMALSLTGCKRFVRVIVRPDIEIGGTTCSVAAGMDTMVSLVFGDATEAPATPTSVRGRIIVTSGCTTASGTST